MSASGHKRTFAMQNVMSALPPKADMCGAGMSASAKSSQTENYSLGPRNLRAPTTAITIKIIHMRIAPVPKTVRPIGSLSQAGRNGIELLNLRSPGPKATQVPIAPQRHDDGQRQQTNRRADPNRRGRRQVTARRCPRASLNDHGKSAKNEPFLQ